MTSTEAESDEELFSTFERGLIRCLRRAKGRSAFSAAGAITHLRKAWKIREADSEMAALRSITAEEEAATALIIHLRERQYVAAQHLNYRDHRVKLALFPFAREFWRMISFSAPVLRPDVRVVQSSDGEWMLDLVYVRENGEELRQARHPLELALFPDSVKGLDAQTVTELPEKLTKRSLRIASAEETAAAEDEQKLLTASRNLGEILAVRLQGHAESAGAKSLQDDLNDEANLRNRLLYAGSGGWPGGVEEIDSFIMNRKNRVVLLLILYGLLFPHRGNALLVRQAVIALAAVLEKVDLADVEEFW
jgi:hypothetical protein